MPLIKPISQKETQNLKLKFDKNILTKIEKYCSWAGIEKLEQFFEQAAEYILKKDTAFKKSEENEHLK